MNEQDAVTRRGVRVWLDVTAVSGLTDEQLLDRFTTDGGQPAEVSFSALVARHGPMVLRACRAVLRNDHDAEDAFQASFLILARCSKSLRACEPLGPWLHRVAARVAIRIRSSTVRRECHERRAAETRVEARESGGPDDIGPVIHSEIERLPVRFRGPVILCDLEGRTHEEAAAQLRCPVGTIKSRLSRARDRLRVQLVRRGIVPTAGGLGMMLAEQSASAVPSNLALATVQTANAFVARGNPDARPVPTQAVILAEGVLKMMSRTKLAVTAIALLLTAIASAGVFALATDRPKENSNPVAKSSAAPAPGGAASAPTEGKTRSTKDLQKERLDILRELAAMTERAYRAGNASFSQFLQAKQAVMNAELELCETEKDCLSLLEKIVALAKDNEKLVLETVRSGNASAQSALEAKLARVEAEIALERAKTKPAATPK